MKNKQASPITKQPDKTDWKRVINGSQSQADLAAAKDMDNPVLDKQQFSKSRSRK